MGSPSSVVMMIVGSDTAGMEGDWEYCGFAVWLTMKKKNKQKINVIIETKFLHPKDNCNWGNVCTHT